MTIGIVLVARLAASAGIDVLATTTSTFARTSSPALSAIRAGVSANLKSSTRFRPSTYPSSRSSWRST
jgi:hypothetical protein